MAGFKTHITVSTSIGVAYGTAAWFLFDVGWGHCFIAGAMCSVAGMLPDLDSRSGVPQREMLSFVSVVVPMLMLDRFRALGWSAEQMVVAAGLIYVIIRFGVGWIFKTFTRHRGMWHSIPAAVLAGMVTFLIVLSPDLGVRLFKAWAVVLGFLSHLVLDEIYSVNWQGRQIRIKKSFGTAMKLFSPDSVWANVTTYGKLILLAVLIASDQSVMNALGSDPVEMHFSPREWFLQTVEQKTDSVLR